MPRHARNSTANAVYTYHEKLKDTQQSGYGSDKLRLGKDSIKDFDCCCLTLQPCHDPVVTKDGYLYDKAAIIEYILHKKKEIAQQWKAYDKQIKKQSKEKEELAKAEEECKTVAFVRRQCGIGDRLAERNKADKHSISNMTVDKKSKLPSFWIPTLTPAAAATAVKKPDERIRCSMSGRPLKMKDLVPVRFTAINDRDDSTAIINKQARYVCAVTNDVLGNSVPCAVIKTSGCVVTMECVEKLIKKDMLDPINSQPITLDDIIPIQMGSGFSASGMTLEVKKDRPVMQA